jgi:hypothetical protein
MDIDLLITLNFHQLITIAPVTFSLFFIFLATISFGWKQVKITLYFLKTYLPGSYSFFLLTNLP